MDPDGSARRGWPAAILAAGVAVPFAVAAALRLAGAGLLVPPAAAALERAAATGLLLAAAIAALALLSGGLRAGNLARLCQAAAAAGLAGAAGVAAAGTPRLPDGTPIFPLDAMMVGGGALLLAGLLADRIGLVVAAPRIRVLAALGLFALVEGVLLAALTAEAGFAAWRPLVLALAAAAGAMAAVSAPTVRSATGPALLAAGAALLALARPGTIEVALPWLMLAGAAVALAVAGGTVPARQLPGRRLNVLPPFAQQLADGVLLFDRRLRLRDWNPAAVALLDLGVDPSGDRLEDLLDHTLGRLQPPAPGDPPGVVELQRPGRAEAALEAWLVSVDDGVAVIVRDPARSPAMRAELDRMGHELRGALEEVLAARRTIELQRTELERAATIDELTGVSSRAAILERLRLEVAQARRYTHPVTVVLVDIDEFSVVNGLHGLGVGDAVLRELALRLRLRVRAADALGRSAADAFLAVLPHTDEAGAATFADALRRRLVQRPIVTEAGPLSMTVSIGVAVMSPGEELDADGLLGRAEEALGAARSAGGDRITLDHREPPRRLPERSIGPVDAKGEDDPTTQDRGA